VKIPLPAILVLVLVLVLVPTASPPAEAANVQTLRAFLRDTASLRARFTQVVLDRQNRKVQETSGTLELLRPGRIRWTYEKPYEQLIVGDGTRLWIYDRDLNQVTVKPLTRAIGGSPAALLAGGDDIEKDFTITPSGIDGGFDWLEAVPRSADATFQRVRIGFGKSGLEAMELHDAFGQVTTIRFAQIERNPKLAPEVFRFAPPKGADVISD